VAHRFPALIAAPAPAQGRLWLTGARLFDGTSIAAEALGLDEHIGTVTQGKLADLVILDGDPLAEPQLLSDPGRIWLVLQQGVQVAGQALVNPAT